MHFPSLFNTLCVVWRRIIHRRRERKVPSPAAVDEQKKSCSAGRSAELSSSWLTHHLSTSCHVQQHQWSLSVQLWGFHILIPDLRCVFTGKCVTLLGSSKVRGEVCDFGGDGAAARTAEPLAADSDLGSAQLPDRVRTFSLPLLLSYR